MILNLHEHGECAGSSSNALIHGPWSVPHPDPGMRRHRNNVDALDLISGFYVVGPHLPGPNDWWKPPKLLALLDHIEGRYPDIDKRHVVLAGFSRGGRGVLDLAIACPNRFSAVAAFCPENAAELEGAAGELSKLPVWIFHNRHERHRRTCPEQTESLYRAASAQRPDRMRRTLFDASAHNCWRSTYATPAFYHWLLEPHRWPDSTREGL